MINYMEKEQVNLLLFSVEKLTLKGQEMDFHTSILIGRMGEDKKEKTNV